MAMVLSVPAIQQGVPSQIMAAGARVEVCALYLPGRRATPEALLPGIGVAAPPEMAAAMMANDTAI
ncbi:MAG: hypothetical protein CVT80_15875 [Alphaproteobacteria bacterium HGW-Alphaproteobacteria-2]|nr:MAG: hypothetical protein CVT80_15875 [Alphaproteobacteria bacterium HGW-Alphaproteobacteria-2]